jgi:DNA-binding NarL/FixJ family response regulator
MPRILIVEDNAAMARCLANIGNKFGSVTVEATVHGARGQLSSALCSAHIIDLHLPDGSGLDIVSLIRSKDGEVPVLILTGNSGHEVINAAFNLRAQYLDKPATRLQIEQFLTSVKDYPSSRELSPSEPLAPLRDGTNTGVNTPGQKARRSDNTLPAQYDLAGWFKLSPAEQNVYVILVQGATNRQIAQHLHVSVETVRSHVQHILLKLGVDSRAYAIAAAHRRNGQEK